MIEKVHDSILSVAQHGCSPLQTLCVRSDWLDAGGRTSGYVLISVQYRWHSTRL